jgi:hypothetical protein
LSIESETQLELSGTQANRQVCIWSRRRQVDSTETHENAEESTVDPEDADDEVRLRIVHVLRQHEWNFQGLFVNW